MVSAGDETREARLDVGRGEQLLLRLGRERRQRGRDGVGDPARDASAADRLGDLVGQERRELRDPPEERRGVTREGLGFEIARRPA